MNSIKTKHSKADVANIYDFGSSFYRYFGRNDPAEFAIHFGIWNKDTKNAKEAVINTNRFLAETAEISGITKVLDFGCGVGGSCLWLAETYGNRVTGISISKKEILKAKELASKFGVDHLADYYVMDYCQTSFSDKTFNVVWALESTIYAADKLLLAKEAFRLLRDKGKIVVGDVFLKRKANTKKEQEWLEIFYRGFTVINLVTANEFTKALKVGGFNDISLANKTQAIIPTSKQRHKLNSFTYPVVKIMEKLKISPPFLTNNSHASKIQYNMFKEGLIEYAVISASK
ncbi:MAG: SAM-dependent methyltransferase [Patescibacteria group bacterium]